jgi:cytidine deaminase
MDLDEKTIERGKDAAGLAAESAYCPYSRFPVGAAVLTEKEELICGCNVENASYGLTICAERNAVFQAVAKGHRRIRAVFVATPSSDRPSPPCGACRQVINEFVPDAEIFSYGGRGELLHSNMQELLPLAFDKADLEAR